MWGAHFKLNGDASVLFPFINGSVSGARYHLRPHHIQFQRESVMCTLYPDEAIASPFQHRSHVFEFIEKMVNYLNQLYEQRHTLTPNHQIYRQPPSVVEIVKALPQTNCRECGYATCMAFAAALRKEEIAPNACPGFAQPISVRTVYPVLGENGRIESTFAIEGKLNTPKPKVQEPKEKADNQTQLYDQFGIRIQYDLTAREIQVLRLLSEGATNPEISEKLHISPHTVKSHVVHIFNKLNVNDRTQAAVWAIRNQII